MSTQDRAGGLFGWAAGAVAPMFARPTPPVALARLVHVLLVAGLVVGAYFLQTLTALNEFIHTPGLPWLGRVWLPALVLLVYALLWSVAWLLGLLAPGQPDVTYPDLDDAWDGILDALAKAGIGVADTPLFIVLGDLPSGFEPVFRSLPHGLAVAGATPAGAPLRAYANREAVYVTLTGASLLGVQEAGAVVDLTAAGGGGGAFDSVAAGQSVGIGRSVGVGVGDSIGASMGGGGPLREIQRLIQQARDQGRPLNEGEKEQVRRLSASERSTAAPTGRAAPANVLQNPHLTAEAEARLAHVCARISATRWPLCPINGAILAVPADAIARDDQAQQWGLVARQDLRVLEGGLKLRFPVYALLGGAEGLPGGAAFFDLFAADKGGQRLGKGFPYNPDASPEQVAAAVEASAAWVLSGLLPYWALKLSRTGGQPADADANAELVRFLDAVRRRGPHLGRLLGRAVGGGDRPPVYGGCYLATARGGDSGTAAFAAEFFKKVQGGQAYVAWTPDAYAEDAAARRKALAGYAALAAIALAVVALAVYAAVVKLPK